VLDRRIAALQHEIELLNVKLGMMIEFRHDLLNGAPR
jgi:hypothetical protein